jgi:hypothetical protein
LCEILANNFIFGQAKRQFQPIYRRRKKYEKLFFVAGSLRFARLLFNPGNAHCGADVGGQFIRAALPELPGGVTG